ncbi:conserved hypothetical protein [Candidatus Desulfarcum epimagneticum]|uniref:Uncharacterized protein n=1 Tax=uncultured Desulfobacteraceae bacterium TaxID=218296 RepID=A0A484HJY2_9BACT|nr:conserved hypothetical protein [uncultured Desulfobacteraceae bacterium]
MSRKPHRILFFGALAGALLFASFFVHKSPVFAGDPEIYFDMGLFAYEEGDHGAAAKHFQKALEIDPDHPESHYYLGAALSKMGRPEEAKGHFERALAQKPDLAEMEYDSAKIAYENGDHAQALAVFEKIAAQDPSHGEAAYYAGLCLFGLKRHREAIPYFESAGENEPSLKDPAVYLSAVSHYHAGMEKQARTRFEYVKNESRSPMLASKAEKWLETIRRKIKEKRRWHLYGRLGYQYDDNVPLTAMSTYSRGSDDDLLGTGYLSVKYDLLKKPRQEISVGYNHYQTLNQKLADYQYLISEGGLYAAHYMESLAFHFQYLHSGTRLGNEPYLRARQIKPGLTWRAFQNHLVNVTYSYSAEDHITDEDQDGYESGAEIALYSGFFKNRANLSLSGGVSRSSKASADYTYLEKQAGAGLTLTLPGDWRLGFYQTYSWDEYERADDGSRRRDEQYYGTASVSMPLWLEGLRLSTEWTYLENHSTDDDYDYRQRTGALHLSFER